MSGLHNAKPSPQMKRVTSNPIADSEVHPFLSSETNYGICLISSWQGMSSFFPAQGTYRASHFPRGLAFLKMDGNY